jgi:PAS domain S-box-containing protein
MNNNHMGEFTDFFKRLLSTDDWTTMWQNGKWSAFHGWLNIGSDLVIGTTLFLIALFAVGYISHKRNLALRGLIGLLSVLILFCSLTFLYDAVLFWWPGYRVSSLLRFITALFSFSGLVAVMATYPRARSMKTSYELERELSESKVSCSKYMSFFESSPYAVIITDKNKKIILSSAQAEKMFGYRKPEIIGKDIESLIIRKFNQANGTLQQEETQDVRKKEPGASYEFHGLRRDGSEFPAEVSLSPLKLTGDDGMIVVTAIRDISKQKQIEADNRQFNLNLERELVQRNAELEHALQTEKALRLEMTSNQNRLEFLKDASEVVTSTLNYCEVLTNLSKSVTPRIADWCVIYEYSAEDESLKTIVVSHANPEKVKLAYDFIEKFPPDPEAPNGIYKVINTLEPELYRVDDEMLKKYARNSEHLQFMQELQIKSALIVPLCIREKIFGVLLLVASESGRIFNEKDVDFAIEIARRAMLGIENAKLYEDSQKINALLEIRVAKRTRELESINKEMEAFSYSVSHDLRAPLRSIDGFSNKILKDYEPLLDEQGKDYFMRVKKASQQMGQLIDDLLKLSRLTRVQIHPEYTDLATIAESITNDLKASDPEREVEFVIKQDMVARADPNLIRIALQNLFDNAWKYTRKNKKTSIEFSFLKKDNQVIYFIKDNGVGFDMQYVDKLFGSFQRLHTTQEFEGSGIGLATVQRIIHRHFGRIWAEGEINKGATFFFTL